jgi:hypothetical protein
MEGVAEYRAILRRLVEEEARRVPATGEIEVIPICDEVRDQYQVLHLGWDLHGRVFAVICHLRLREGKVWVERDGTAEGVALRLLEAGIPRERIVLAFHPAWKRPATDFAIA